MRGSNTQHQKSCTSSTASPSLSHHTCDLGTWSRSSALPGARCHLYMVQTIIQVPLRYVEANSISRTAPCCTAFSQRCCTCAPSSTPGLAGLHECTAPLLMPAMGSTSSKVGLGRVEGVHIATLHARHGVDGCVDQRRAPRSKRQPAGHA